MEQTLTAFEEEVQVMVEAAARLGQHARDGEQEEFLRCLGAMDIPEDQAAKFWHSVCKKGQVVTNLEGVKNNYDAASRLGILLDSSPFPRNLLLYLFLQHYFGDFFEVSVSGTVHMGGKESRGNPPGRRVVRFPKHPVVDVSNGRGRAEAMAAYKVFQGVRPSQFSERVLQAAAPLRKAMGDQLGLKMAELLLGAKMLIPSERMSQALARVIRAGIQGDTVTLVGAFCPDYAYEVTCDPQIPYRYTFDGLGNGVGLVAQQFARIVPPLSLFLSEMRIKHQFILGIGDFEARSQAVLDRVQVSYGEFICRCQGSLDAFKAMMPAGIPVTLELFGEERSRGRLDPYTEEAVAAMLRGNFGMMPALHEDLKEVLERLPGQYRTFYERWHGISLGDEEVRRIIYQQGGEYAAVARIYEEDHGRNIIILAGDRPEMNRFNAFFSTTPTLCAKRAY